MIINFDFARRRFMIDAEISFLYTYVLLYAIAFSTFVFKLIRLGLRNDWA